MHFYNMPSLNLREIRIPCNIVIILTSSVTASREYAFPCPMEVQGQLTTTQLHTQTFPPSR